MKEKQVIYQINQDGTADLVKDKLPLDPNKLYWVRLDLSQAKAFIKTLSDVPTQAMELLCATETRPRTMAVQNTLLAAFRAVNLTEGSEPEDMVSIRVWINKNLIVTVQRRDCRALDDIVGLFANESGPESAPQFLEMMLREIADNTSDVLEKLGDALDEIEDRLAQKRAIDVRAELSEIRRRVILLRRYLVPQREAINRIPADKITWLNESNLMRFRELTDLSTRILEDLDAERERATVIHEELYAIAQEAMNQKMFILSIVAIIFMPLSFLTGLLGINVGGIPGADYRLGFWVVCGVMFIVFIGQMIYLRTKRWI